MDNKIFKNGISWFDTDGNVIHAHGGHIVKFGDTYYWYGENRNGNAYVSCYASKDLNNWEFRRNILTTESKTEDLGAINVLDFGKDLDLITKGKKINIERPKVIYNKKTKKYIMYAHYESGKNYFTAAVAVASCDTPDGDFTYHGYFRPCRYMSRDCNVFEVDNEMYLISAAHEMNQDLHVYRMQDDYMGVSEKVAELFVGESREAPALFSHEKRIYMITSECTGWRPNQGGYSYSDSLIDGWKEVSNCGDEITYRSQPTAVLTLNINGKNQYIYIGDRWGGNQWEGYNNFEDDSEYLKTFVYENSSYYFTLIEINEDGTLELKKCEEFTIDLDGDGFVIVK